MTCHVCSGGGIVGDERSHRSCSVCAGIGLARTLQDLLAERRVLLQEMRAAGARGEIAVRETIRAEVAVLDAEIAAARGEAA